MALCVTRRGNVIEWSTDVGQRPLSSCKTLNRITVVATAMFNGNTSSNHNHYLENEYTRRSGLVIPWMALGNDFVITSLANEVSRSALDSARVCEHRINCCLHFVRLARVKIFRAMEVRRTAFALLSPSERATLIKRNSREPRAHRPALRCIQIQVTLSIIIIANNRINYSVSSSALKTSTFHSKNRKVGIYNRFDSTISKVFGHTMNHRLSFKHSERIFLPHELGTMDVCGCERSVSHPNECSLFSVMQFDERCSSPVLSVRYY